MHANKRFAIGTLCAVIAVASSAALAAPSLVSTDYRYASQADNTITRGGGTASDSKLLPRGLRLASPGAREEVGKAVATAVYVFKVPLAAATFTIEVGYRADAQAREGEIAGFLFVRNHKATEGQPIEPESRPKPQKDDPTPSGDTYFLKGNETTASITVQAENRVMDGILEVRLTAEAGQTFDAQYVQVVSHRSAGDYASARGHQTPDVPSGRAHDPLRYQQRPSPSFYGYGVPNLYPNLYGAGHADSQDPIFWNQVWQMQRPHLYNLYPYPYPYRSGRGHKSHKK